MFFYEKQLNFLFVNYRESCCYLERKHDHTRKHIVELGWLNKTLIGIMNTTNYI